MKVNRYQFDTIAEKSKKKLSKPIQHGDEQRCLVYLCQLEILLYREHEKYGINGRQAKEILQTVLYDIKEITDGEQYDCTKWEEECYRACADGVETLFLPEKNEALKAALKPEVSMDDAYFEIAREAIIRTYESICQWSEEYGEKGYFKFLGNYVLDGIQANKPFMVDDKYLQ